MLLLLEFDRHGVDRVGLGLVLSPGRGKSLLLVLLEVQKRARQPPRPLHVVGPLSTRRQRHSTVHAAVNGVEVPRNQAQAGAVNGVEPVEDGEVDLGRQVHELELLARELDERNGLVVHY